MVVASAVQVWDTMSGLHRLRCASGHLIESRAISEDVVVFECQRCGEGYMMRTNDRGEVLERWSESVDRKVPVANWRRARMPLQSVRVSYAVMRSSHPTGRKDIGCDPQT